LGGNNEQNYCVQLSSIKQLMYRNYTENLRAWARFLAACAPWPQHRTATGSVSALGVASWHMGWGLGSGGKCQKNFLLSLNFLIEKVTGGEVSPTNSENLAGLTTAKRCLSAFKVKFLSLCLHMYSTVCISKFQIMAYL